MKRPGRLSPGFTFIEVMVGSGLLVGLAVGWGAFVRQYTGASKRGRFEFHMAKEHKAISAVATSIPKRAILHQECVFNYQPPQGAPVATWGAPNSPAPGPNFRSEISGNVHPQGTAPNGPPTFTWGPRPHPYRYVDPDGTCVPRGLPQEATDAAKYRPDYFPATWNLYNRIWQWAATGNRYGGDALNTNLDPIFLAAQVIPAAAAAGCMNCHDGVGGVSKAGGANRLPPWIRDCNFNVAAHWTGVCMTGMGAEPLAMKDMVASRLGQLFLPPGDPAVRVPLGMQPARDAFDQITSSFLLNRQATQLSLANITSLTYGSLLTNRVNYGSWTQTSTAGTVTTEQRIDDPNCTCTSTGATPAGPGCCPTGGVPNPGSCNKFCTDFTTGKCSCGKDCFTPCQPTCVNNTTAISHAYTCTRTDLGIPFSLPFISITTTGPDPDPTRNGVKTMSSGLVPR